MASPRVVFRVAAAGLVAATLLISGSTFATPSYRNPVVLAIAPDTVNCDDPDDPDNVEDVVISGLCFRGDITGAFLSTSADGTGTRVDLANVINIGPNQVTATVPLSQLSARDQPYYVFVVRGDGKVSTSFPNAFGFDVTFTCTAGTSTSEGALLTSCRVARTASGRFVLVVDGEGFVPGVSRVLLDGEPCRRTKYLSRGADGSGASTRILCVDQLKRRLPAAVTVEITPGVVSSNSLRCELGT